MSINSAIKMWTDEAPDYNAASPSTFNTTDHPHKYPHPDLSLPVLLRLLLQKTTPTSRVRSSFSLSLSLSLRLLISLTLIWFLLNLMQRSSGREPKRSAVPSQPAWTLTPLEAIPRTRKTPSITSASMTLEMSSGSLLRMSRYVKLSSWLRKQDLRSGSCADLLQRVILISSFSSSIGRALPARTARMMDGHHSHLLPLSSTYFVTMSSGMCADRLSGRRF